MQHVLENYTVGRLARAIPLIGPYSPSLLETLFPRAGFLFKLLVAFAFVGLLVGCGRARFYLPENPVPITFQTFGVLLTGAVMGARWGLFSILFWYFLGMASLPVFQGGNPRGYGIEGWEYLSDSPTAGYIIGFILATTVVGYLSQHGWNRGKSLWPILLGGLILYLPGLPWLAIKSARVTQDTVFAKGMYPFIPGDLVKIMMASLASGLLWTIADRRGRRS